MRNGTSERLRKNANRIMQLWSERAIQEIAAAKDQQKLALWNSLPEFLEHLADALSTTIERTAARKAFDQARLVRVGKEHGMQRSKAENYTVDQVIFEYHILRQVICDVLEEEAPLAPAERELISCVIEDAVNLAATQFSDALRDVQEIMTQTLVHDLRNPIMAAKSSAQLILRSPEDSGLVVKAASRIFIDMERIESMIADILDASRARAGLGLNLQFGNCDLGVIARQVAEEFNFVYPRRFVVFTEGQCVGYWSENGLRRVLDNLVKNAVKYGAPERPIKIIVRQASDAVIVAIHNEGEPISKDEQEILFQQFRRARPAGAKAGWGLGLVVVKGVVNAHHGEIQVKSEKGFGTTFSIELP